MSQKFRLVKFLSFLILHVFCMQAFSQVNDDGIPFIANYNARDYNANEANWSIAQDNRGVMYFGNDNYILEYDGRNWDRIVMTGQSFIRSLASNNQGVIYVGGVDDFGHLVIDSVGQLIYESLAGLISGEKTITNVWKTYSHNGLIYFCTLQYIYIYDESSRAIEVIELPNKSFISFLVEGKLFVGNLDYGPLELQNSEVNKLKGGEYFIDKDIFSMVPWSGDTILIYTIQDGLSFYNIKTGNVSGFNFSDQAKNTNKLLKESYIYSAAKMNDSLFAFGSQVNGVFIVNKSGVIVNHLNEQLGLQNEIVTNLYYSGEDKGVLWLALINGISSVNICSPVRMFASESGLYGPVNSITKHKGAYYVATLQGVFRKDISSEGHTIFNDIKGISGGVYALLNFKTPNKKEKLIAASTRNIYEIKGDQAIELTSFNVEAYWLLQSEVYPEKVYVGTSQMLYEILLVNDKLIFQEKEVIKIDGEQIVKITEDKNGKLWLKTLSEIYFLEPDGTFKELPATISGKTGSFFKLKEDLFFISDNKVFKYNLSEHEFIPYTGFNQLFLEKEKKLRDVFPLSDLKAIAHYNYDNEIHNDLLTWSEKGWIVDDLSLRIIPQVTIANAFKDGNFVLIGSPDGLFIYNESRKKDFNQIYRTLIRSVVLDFDSVLYKGGQGFFEIERYNGIYINRLHTPVKYANNNITFNYASPYFENEDDLDYSNYLEGFDQDWSPWQSDVSRTFTNLREGNYRFHVKAKNIYGVESQATIVEFTVLPPWYRTWWAYIIYVILGLGIIAISISLYTRKLQQDKKRLEEIVRQRTAEILEKNKEIEQKNKSITDSIRYAKRIQTAVLPDKQTSEMFEYFVYFKPKDIVSGDFYWLRHFEDKKQLIVAAADCTGHGVPGAFMSMLGTAFLNEIVAKSEFQHADEILNTLREYVINALKQGLKEEERDEQKDGMDLGLVVIDLDKKELEFSGANNSMLFFRNGEITEYKPDKMPIGTYRRQDESFTRVNIKLQNGDTFYLFSDGYIDQFGGEEGRKYMKKQFRELLLAIHTKPISEQKQLLEEDMAEWSKFHEQLDDQIVIGMRAVF